MATVIVAALAIVAYRSMHPPLLLTAVGVGLCWGALAGYAARLRRAAAKRRDETDR